MQVIKVEGGVLSIGQGAVMLLTPAQHAARRYYGIEKAEPVGDVMLCVAKVALQFKAGEVLGVDNVSKPMASLARDATPEDGEVAMQMIAAAATLGAPEPAPAAPEPVKRSRGR